MSWPPRRGWILLSTERGLVSDGSAVTALLNNSAAYLQQRHNIPPELLQNIAVVEALATKAAES